MLLLLQTISESTKNEVPSQGQKCCRLPTHEVWPPAQVLSGHAQGKLPETAFDPPLKV